MWYDKPSWQRKWAEADRLPRPDGIIIPHRHPNGGTQTCCFTIRPGSRPQEVDLGELRTSSRVGSVLPGAIDSKSNLELKSDFTAALCIVACHWWYNANLNKAAIRRPT